MFVARTEHQWTCMGGPARLLLDTPADAPEGLTRHAIAAAVTELERLESRYSRYRPDSAVSQLNAAAGSGQRLPIDEEMFGLCEYATVLWRESDGDFDPTSGVLRRAWDFRGNRLPASAEVKKLLPLVGWDRLSYDTDSWSLPAAGMELDFGGLVKEYATDSAKRVLRESGIAHALVDLAGDMATLGTQGDGSPWPVGVRHPRDPGRSLASTRLAGDALASSGDYERRIVIEGKSYGHLLNPRTGWPVQGLVCASVVADQCLVAGSTATTALLKPARDGLDWLAAQGLPWIAVDADMQVHGSLRR